LCLTKHALASREVRGAAKPFYLRLHPTALSLFLRLQFQLYTRCNASSRS